jgi:hypothetical protein
VLARHQGRAQNRDYRAQCSAMALTPEGRGGAGIPFQRSSNGDERASQLFATTSRQGRRRYHRASRRFESAVIIRGQAGP